MDDGSSPLPLETWWSSVTLTSRVLEFLDHTLAFHQPSRRHSKNQWHGNRILSWRYALKEHLPLLHSCLAWAPMGGIFSREAPRKPASFEQLNFLSLNTWILIFFFVWPPVALHLHSDSVFMCQTDSWLCFIFLFSFSLCPGYFVYIILILL